MEQTVRLTVLTGPHRGDRVCVRGNSRCRIGRSPDCTLCLNGSVKDVFISRHHCELLVDPPNVMVQDTNSANGTYLNGSLVGERESAELMKALFGDYPKLETVESGSILTIGETSIQIDLMECPPSSEENPEEPLWQEGESVKKNCRVRC